MLTTIVSQDPMYITFDIDERTILRLRRLLQEGKLQSRSQTEVPVLAALADEDNFPHKGILNFSENRIDPSTGTLRIRGVVDNPTPRLLSPGLFIRVRLPIGKPHKAVMIAERALGTDQGEKFVYVVNAKDVIVSRPIKVGSLNDGMRVVEKGLKAGERVVVSGQQRIRPGVKVIAKPAEDYSNRAGHQNPGCSGEDDAAGG